jgi:hypothetical protein
MSLAPVPSEQPADSQSCTNCAAPLAPDQRYCLACGHPVSPVLADLVSVAFLDVLQADAQPYGAIGQGSTGALAPGYAPAYEPVSGSNAWLRRYSGLFGLLSVLLLAVVVGLLVGHWVTQSKAPSQQVLKVEGLPSAAATPLAAAPAVTGASTTATTPKPATKSKETAQTEAHEAKEAKAIEKAPPPKAVKVSSSKLQKLGNSSGQKHEEEVNKLGAQPIETGGG